jgi:hypothetical protein
MNSSVTLSSFGTKAEFWFDTKIDGEPGELALYADGTRAWFQDGKLHRIEGPAIEYAQDFRNPRKIINKSWYICGVPCTEKEHKKLTKGSNTELLLMMGQGYDKYIEHRLKQKKL